MFTSYYAKSGKHPDAISIASRAPDNYKGKEYKKLAPPVWLIKKYKSDFDVEFYTKNFKAEVLDKIDPKEVVKELGDNAVLLCWEKKGKFCHRHLIAKWLKEKLGLNVTEL